MWPKAHRIEQSRLFKALITLPWVASGRRSGQSRGGSGMASARGSAVGLLEFRCRHCGADPLCRDRLPAENGTALYALFRSVGADLGVTMSDALAWAGRRGACLANETRARGSLDR